MKNTVVAQMRKKNTAITGYLKKIKKILWSEYHAPIPVTGISSHLFREVSLNSNHEQSSTKLCLHLCRSSLNNHTRHTEQISLHQSTALH